MAKVKNPLFSVQASGKIGGNHRFARSRSQDRCLNRRTGQATAGLGQRRQASVISEGARIWNTRDGRGPEPSYREYVSGISADNWYFMTDAVLLEWDANTLMPAN